MCSQVSRARKLEPGELIMHYSRLLQLASGVKTDRECQMPNAMPRNASSLQLYPIPYLCIHALLVNPQLQKEKKPEVESACVVTHLYR